MTAEFLSTTGASYQIDRIISEAMNEIVMITPDLKIHESIILKLKQADQKNIRITFVYGNDKNQVKSLKWHKNLGNLRILFNGAVRARIYRNEKDMMLTSMDLADFTSTSYTDLGILVTKSRNRKAFEDGLYEQELIIESSEEMFSGKNYVVQSDRKDPEAIIKEMPYITYFGMEDRSLINGRVKAPSGKLYSPEMEFYNDGTIKHQGFTKTKNRHGEWIFYTYDGFVREVVIYENGSYLNKIFCDYENRSKSISKYYLLFGIGNSVRKVYGKNIKDLYFDKKIEDFTGYDQNKLFYHIERFIGVRDIFMEPETFQDLVDQLYSALYE